MPQPRSRRDDEFDVAVVGAGVIGCAIARRYAIAGARVVVLERASDILDGASKGNSAILHTGFDAPPGSLEAACVTAGYREYLDIRGRLGLPLLRTGALVIAGPASLPPAGAAWSVDVPTVGFAGSRENSPTMSSFVCTAIDRSQ